MNWWVTAALEAGGVGLVAAWAIWVIVSITLHELAHGWAAISRGDLTPIHTGHMTWNPLVHMGGPSLIIFAVTGIAWGMMPVDPSRMRGRYADAFVSAAGPAMNFALAAFCILAGVIGEIVLNSGSGDPNMEMLRSTRLFFGVGCWLNVALGLFNLIPAPPLDGSRILANFSRKYQEFLFTQGGQFVGLLVFMVAFLFAGRIVFGLGTEAWRLGFGGILSALEAVGIGPGSPW